MRLLHKTRPPYGSDRKPGWRILLPIFPRRRKGYNPTWDEFHTGVWWWAVGLGVEPLVVGAPLHRVGTSLRITWGWLTFSRAAELPAFQSRAL
jgi:hypothetical protein